MPFPSTRPAHRDPATRPTGADDPAHTPARRRVRGRSDRLRLDRLRRHPLGPAAGWAAAAALLAVSAVLSTSAARDAAADRRAYGETVALWVLRRDVGAGDVLGADDVTRRDLPRALVPPVAVAADTPDGSRDDSPVGRTARDPLLAGEVVLEARLGPPGRSGTPATLRAGELALAVPALGAPPVRPGDDLVVLVVTDGRDGADGSGSTARSGVAARAIDVGDDTLVVAVAAAEAPRLAAAVRRGDVVVGLTGG